MSTLLAEAGRASAAPLAVAIAALLCVPLLMGYAVRVVARRAPPADNPLLVMAVRLLRWLVIPAVALGWCVVPVIVVQGLSPWRFFSPLEEMLVPMALAFGPALLFLALASGLVHREVARAFTGRPGAIGERLQGYGALVVVFVLGCTVGLDPGGARALALVMLAVLVVFGFLKRRTSPRAYALAPGALREGIARVADTMTVELKDIYLVPAWAEREARFAAAKDDALCLTLEAVEALSAPELDAFAASEVARLRRQHRRRILGTRIAALVVLLGPPTAPQLQWAFGLLQMIGPWHSIPSGPQLFVPLFALKVALSFSVLLALQARAERRADDEAADALPDPSLLPAAIARLLERGAFPEAPFSIGNSLWGCDRELLRLQGLRRQYPPTERETAERRASYEIPQGIERRFSPELRGKLTMRRSRYQLAVTCTLPVLVAHALPALSPLGAVLLGAAGVVGTALIASLGDLLTMRTFARLKDALATREADPALGLLGYTQGTSPRVYDGLPVYDLGLLSIEHGTLAYRGEDVSFLIPSSSIRDVSMERASPAWFSPPRVTLRWQDRDQRGAFGLVPIATSWRDLLRPPARAIARVIQEARDAVPETTSPAVPPPPIPEGIRPGDFVTLRRAVTYSFNCGVYCAAFGVLTGIPAAPPGAALAYLGVAGAAAACLQMAPFLLHRDRHDPLA